jgi:hypothetical protein
LINPNRILRVTAEGNVDAGKAQTQILECFFVFLLEEVHGKEIEVRDIVQVVNFDASLQVQ